MQSLYYYIKHPKVLGNVVLVHYCGWMPDRLYLKLKFKMIAGKRLNLKAPQSFNEKLQWLKLYNRRPEYTMMVDKVRVKDYVASVIGEQYIIPTIAVWKDPDEIDFDKLPERFVLKVNHNSGTGMYICRDKSKMDVEKVKAELRKGLKENYFKKNREWPYKNVERRILAEQFMADDNHKDLTDYKFFCFHGIPKYCQVIQNRRTKETIDFFDMDWIHQPFIGLNEEVSNAEQIPIRPSRFDEMKRVASLLSEGIPFSRIDLYEINSKVYFGEITFFPASAQGIFRPSKWDYTFGSWIKLPEKN